MNQPAFFRFLKYAWKASTVYDLHSPLAYSFAREVLEDRRNYYIFSDAENLRAEWLRDRRKIQVSDFGAGSTAFKSSERSISDLARKVATPPLFCRWLFRIVQFSRPETMLEMGASLGISALYQSAAAPSARFIAIEGCPQTAQLAKHTFQKMKCPAELLTGRFEEQLPTALAQLGRLDYLYLDGDHSLEGTLKYLRACLPYSHPESVWVIGDIHWSEGMERAWQELKSWPEVRMSFDLFGLGVILFRREIRDPAHFVLAPSLWKPWRLGRWGGL